MTTVQPSLRRLVVTLTIGSFSIAALMGIVALLAGGAFGDTGLRVLGTTFVVGCSSMVVLCYLGTTGTRFAWFGAVGAIFDVVAVVTALWMIWGNDASRGEAVGKTLGVAVVGAVTLAQVCLLLVLARRRVSIAPLVWVTIGLAGLLGATISATIIGAQPGETTVRLIGVVAILDVLGTIVGIALAIFGGDPQVAPATSTLSLRLDGPLADRLRTRADGAGQTVDALAREALEAYLVTSGSPAAD